MLDATGTCADAADGTPSGAMAHEKARTACRTLSMENTSKLE
jgi:hypothetical protein